MPKKTLKTWCGSRVDESKWRDVLKGWQRFAKKLLSDLTAKAALPAAERQSLEYQLCEILQRRLGEIGSPSNGEGAVDILSRIIHERDTALTILARDRLRQALNDQPPLQCATVAIPPEPRFHEIKIRMPRR